MAYYLTNNWDNLSEYERREIKMQALEAQQKANHTICLWCGEPLCSGDYDFTGSPNNRREICKGYCKRLRYFDMPRQSNTPTTHPLSAHPSDFVGYEPMEVMFGDESEPVTSWAEAYQAILRHIILKDFVFYERLIDLRRSLSAHKKPFLSKKPDAKSCYTDACNIMFDVWCKFTKQDALENATSWALKSLTYSVGKFHPDYCYAESLEKEAV